ncbi:MAG: HPF/RaiA family ribosome-associated protein [Gammaproteobacteria bacterium]|nr:HPF/RaiA family ribosome-associated protein [Gammaproteobacteria bacterium]
MLIQINTDRNIEGREELAGRVEEKIRSALGRFDERLTRIEVHLGDENSDKKLGEDDKRCLLEGRPAGLAPIAVDHRAPTMELAVDGAIDKFRRALDSEIGKRRQR